MSNYSQVNNLEEIVFIGGTEYTIDFIVYDQNGGYGNLSGATCSWKMCPYGEPSNVLLTYSGTVINSYTFRVTILANDTLSLSGKFQHQPIIVDSGKTYRSQQGIINISAAIN